MRRLPSTQVNGGEEASFGLFGSSQEHFYRVQTPSGRRLAARALDGVRIFKPWVMAEQPEEGLSDGGMVERLAERIARGKRSNGRPRGLKRFETAP